MAAGATGLLLGGGVGAALSWLILPIYYAHSTGGELSYSLLVHGGIWLAVGAAAGLAFGIGLGGSVRCAPRGTGEACAALLAAVIYEFAGGILFPQALTDRPLSQTWESRLLARLLVTLIDRRRHGSFHAIGRRGKDTLARPTTRGEVCTCQALSTQKRRLRVVAIGATLLAATACGIGWWTTRAAD